MTLKSAMQDLQDRTLRAVSGLLGKLRYLASLRGPDGSYSHWGLERVHGQSATERALKDAHRGVVSSILRTPLHRLVQDVEQSVGSQDGSVDLLQDLEKHSAELIPPTPGAGTERHLSSVLHGLLRLVRHRR